VEEEEEEEVGRYESVTTASRDPGSVGLVVRLPGGGSFLLMGLGVLVLRGRRSGSGRVSVWVSEVLTLMLEGFVSGETPDIGVEARMWA
jgi:hypothetical protein